MVIENCKNCDIAIDIFKFYGKSTFILIECQQCKKYFCIDCIEKHHCKVNLV